MNKLLAIIPLVLILLAMPILSSKIYEPYDNSIAITDKFNIKLLNSQCNQPTYCEAELEFIPYKNMIIGKNNLDIINLQGNIQVKDYHYELLTDVYNDIQTYKYDCKESNKTFVGSKLSNCIKNPDKVEKQLTSRQYKTIDINNYLFEKSKTYHLKIVANIQPSLNYQSADWIQTIDGEKLTEWAVWSTNWTGVRRVIVNNTFRDFNVSDYADGSGIVNTSARFTLKYILDDKDIYAVNPSLNSTRFIYEDNATVLPYWYYNITNGSSIVYVNLVNNYTGNWLNNTQRTFYIYFGNTLVGHAMNFNDTFLMADDFENNGLSPLKWTNYTATTSVINITDGQLLIKGSGAWDGYATTTKAFARKEGLTFAYRMQSGANYMLHGFGTEFSAGNIYTIFNVVNNIDMCVASGTCSPQPSTGYTTTSTSAWYEYYNNASASDLFFNYATLNTTSYINLWNVSESTSTLNYYFEKNGGTALIDDFRAFITKPALYSTENSTINGTTPFSASMIINVYNESSGAFILDNVTVNIYNNTNATSYTFDTGTKTLDKTINPLLNGNITIQCTYLGVTRYYVIQNTPLTNDTINIYMPTITVQAYTIYTKFQDSPIYSVKVIISKIVNGTYHTITQDYTDTAGTMSVFLVPSQPIQIIATNPVYQNYLNYTTPSPTSSVININMLPLGTGNLTLPPINSWMLPNLSIVYNPNTSYVFQRTRVNVTILDQLYTPDLIFNITFCPYYANCSTFKYTSFTGSSTYTDSTILNETGRYYYILTLTRNSQTYLTQQLFISYNSSGVPDFKQVDKQGGPSIIFWQIIAFVCLCAMLMLLAPVLGIYTLFIQIATVGLLTWFNILDIGQAIFIIIVSLVVIKALSGSR